MAKIRVQGDESGEIEHKTSWEINRIPVLLFVCILTFISGVLLVIFSVNHTKNGLRDAIEVNIEANSNSNSNTNSNTIDQSSIDLDASNSNTNDHTIDQVSIDLDASNSKTIDQVSIDLDDEKIHNAEEPVCDSPLAPTIPGVLNPTPPYARVLLGVAPDYPPYTGWTSDPTMPLDLSGFSVDLGKLMEPMCGIHVDFTLDAWSNCWTGKPDDIYFSEVNEYIGESVSTGKVHGCTAYTHTKGERGLTLEFSDAILGDLKTAGILARMENGEPIVSPETVDFTGLKVCDVSGWAPTSDTFTFNNNYCVEGAPNFVFDGAIATPAAGDGPENGIAALNSGECDLLYIYGDQLYNFAGTEDAEGFGMNFTFIHIGLDQWSYNGTTFAMSKRGSGLKTLLDPCIAKIAGTPEYMEVCTSYFEETSCIGGGDEVVFYDVKMNERVDSYTCADGYCQCASRRRLTAADKGQYVTDKAGKKKVLLMDDLKHKENRKADMFPRKAKVGKNKK